MERLGDVAIEIWEKMELQVCLSGCLNTTRHGTVTEEESQVYPLAVDHSSAVIRAAGVRTRARGGWISTCGERFLPAVSWRSFR